MCILMGTLSYDATLPFPCFRSLSMESTLKGKTLLPFFLEEFGPPGRQTVSHENCCKDGTNVWRCI